MAEPSLPNSPMPAPRPARWQPQHLHITYETEIGGATETRELPFIVGVLANLTPQPEEPLPNLRSRRFIEINSVNFDAVMERMQPRVTFMAENVLTDEADSAKLECDLRFCSLSDFEPYNVAGQLKPARCLLDLRRQLSDLLGLLEGNDQLGKLIYEAIEKNGVLELFRTQSGSASPADGGDLPAKFNVIPVIAELWSSAGGSLDSPEREAGEKLLCVFFGQLVRGEMEILPEIQATINARVAQIDWLLSLQLNEVLHHPQFQSIEASWRGLRYLLDKTPTDPLIRIRVLNASKHELLRDLQEVAKFDQSAMFASVYEERFAINGGEPFAVLIGDYYFSRNPEDIDLLEKVSSVAAAAHAPFISAADPGLFSLDSFVNLYSARNLFKIFDSVEYAKWQYFRDSEESRYVGLVLPRMLMRDVYDNKSNIADGFAYDERVDGSDHSRYLWCNSAYAFASRLTNAFARFGWTGSIAGVEHGGLVEQLPIHAFLTDAGDVAMKCPTEVPLTEQREGELAQLGFVPLCHCRGTDYACFFSGNSVHDAQTDERGAAAEHGWRELRYIFAICRFAHYLKVIVRDEIGGFTSRQEIETALNRWISRYVMDPADKDDVDNEPRPLRAASVHVVEMTTRPAAYNAVVNLQPELQVPPLNTPFRLVVALPPPTR